MLRSSSSMTHPPPHWGDTAQRCHDLPDCGATDGLCPTCGAPLQTGFGLAGGGYGVYEYCASEARNKVATKTDVNE